MNRFKFYYKNEFKDSVLEILNFLKTIFIAYLN